MFVTPKKNGAGDRDHAFSERFNLPINECYSHYIFIIKVHAIDVARNRRNSDADNANYRSLRGPDPA